MMCCPYCGSESLREEKSGSFGNYTGRIICGSCGRVIKDTDACYRAADEY